MIGMVSCAETEIISEPEFTPGDEITLNLTATESLSTRAGSDHNLRFTAKLFKDKYNSDQGNQFLDVKQGIASNGECTIVFNVPTGDYQILIFADYIPKSSTANSDGLYPDAYYDTSSKNEDIRMIAFSTNDSDHTYISQNCINNDNYDCFSGMTEVIHKTTAKHEESIVLKRATAKVRFVSITDAPASVNNISFKQFYCFDWYKQFFQKVTCEKKYNQMRLSSHQLSSMSNPSENELFYFYTLAPNDDDTNLGTFDFDISFANGTSRNVYIGGGKIKVKKNHVTTVRGALLSDPAGDSNEDGDIILHLTPSLDWENPEITTTTTM